MNKLLKKTKDFNTGWHEYLSSRVLFAITIIGVLTVFNLSANVFNSYMAFTGKADQRKLREAQGQISNNLDRLERQQQSIEKLQIQVGESEVNAGDLDKRQTASDVRQDKSDVRQTKSETNANKGNDH